MDTEKRNTVENGRLGLRHYWDVGLSWVGGSDISITQAKYLFNVTAQEGDDNGIQSAVAQQIDLFDLRKWDTMAVDDYADLSGAVSDKGDGSQASS